MARRGRKRHREGGEEESETEDECVSPLVCHTQQSVEDDGVADEEMAQAEQAAPTTTPEQPKLQHTQLMQEATEDQLATAAAPLQDNKQAQLAKESAQSVPQQDRTPATSKAAEDNKDTPEASNTEAKTTSATSIEQAEAKPGSTKLAFQDSDCRSFHFQFEP